MTINFRNGVLGAAVALSTLASAQAALAYERWIDIINDGEVAIYSVHITNIHQDTWGTDDLLGRYMIAAGSEMRVTPRNIQGYCRFDVLVTFEDGAEAPVYDVNLCEATTIFAANDGHAEAY